MGTGAPTLEKSKVGLGAAAAVLVFIILHGGAALLAYAELKGRVGELDRWRDSHEASVSVRVDKRDGQVHALEESEHALELRVLGDEHDIGALRSDVSEVKTDVKKLLERVPAGDTRAAGYRVPR